VTQPRLPSDAIVIQSTKNPWVQSVVRLHKSSVRREKKRFLIEGVNLVSEGIRCGWPLDSIVVTQHWLETSPGWFGELDSRVPLHLVSDQVMKVMATTESPDGILAVARFREPHPEQSQRPSLGLALDGLQDPGNLGTLLRSAVACDADSVVLGDGSVDPYNPKVLRSTAGQWFRMPPQQVSLKAWLKANRENGVQVLAASMGGKSFWEWDFLGPTIFILGNEGSGVSKEVLDQCDGVVSVPMKDNVESLNVAMTGTLLLYETVRQRNQSPRYS
jgi:TrmH family RNA methyltransferase